MHAIDDFDTAMKSTLPVQYFRQFVNNWTDYSKISECEPLARNCKKYYEIFQLITIYNLMQNKMNHNIEAYERKLKKWKKTQDRGVEPPAPQIHQDQKDIIVQIMQILDKYLHTCFPK